MKCLNCGSEWNTNSSYPQLKSCPFCGKPLSVPNDNKEEITVSKTIKGIIDQFGLDIILQKNKFLSIFGDYAPRLKKEKKMISIALDENIADLFVNCEIEEREANIQKARRAMNLIMSESAIDLVISSFIDALGWDIGKLDSDCTNMDDIVLSEEKIDTVNYEFETSEELFHIVQDSLTKIEKSGIIFNQQRFESERNDKRFQNACDELNRENYGTALKIFNELLYPETRNPNKIVNTLAGIKLAQMYFWGEGVEVDKKKSVQIMVSLIDCRNPLVIAWISEYYRIAITNVSVKSPEFSKIIYDICSNELKLMADLGDPDAQYFLGFNLIYGLNCNKNESEGFRYIKSSVENKNIHASVTLASCYIEGIGTSKDVAKGIHILLNLEGSSCPQVQYKLGLIYYLDKYQDYVHRDYSKALKYFLSAATCGHVSAKDYVGDMYYYGYGVKVNYDIAKQWYELAAAGENTHATAQLGMIYYCGNGVPEDEDSAFHYFKIAADKGNTYSQYMLHLFYFSDGKYKNYELGRQYLEKAAKQGDVDSQKLLARMYVSDFGFSDDSKFVYWIRKAAEQGDGEAERILGEAYIKFDNNKVLPTDYNKAIVWLDRAVMHNNIEAMVCLMEVYSEGFGVPVNAVKVNNLVNEITAKMKDNEYTEEILGMIDRITKVAINIGKYYYELGKFEVSFSHFEQAYDADKTGEAARWLGVCYKNGFGVKKNKKKAKEYFKEAANKGDSIANNELKKFIF